jgi:hypothetical protein
MKRRPRSEWIWLEDDELIATATEWIDWDRSRALGILDKNGNMLYWEPDTVEYFGFVKLEEKE